MKTIIHVNQHIIKKNTMLRNTAGFVPDPPLTVKTYKSNQNAFDAVIRDENGNEVARVVYRPDHPLSCGARVWIETKLDVETY